MARCRRMGSRGRRRGRRQRRVPPLRGNAGAYVVALALAIAGAVAITNWGPNHRNPTAAAAERLLDPLSDLPQKNITLGENHAKERLAVYADVLSGQFGTFE